MSLAPEQTGTVKASGEWRNPPPILRAEATSPMGESQPGQDTWNISVSAPRASIQKSLSTNRQKTRPARREDALCRARGPTFPNHCQNLLSGLRHMGIGQEEMTVHGFRAMAKTILDEVLGFRPDFIKHQLAHAVRDSNGRAYNRTAYLPERRKMMHLWFNRHS